MLKVAKDEAAIHLVEGLAADMEALLHEFLADADEAFNARALAEPKNAEKLMVDLQTEQGYYSACIEVMVAGFRAFCEKDRERLLKHDGKPA